MIGHWDKISCVVLAEQETGTTFRYGVRPNRMLLFRSSLGFY